MKNAISALLYLLIPFLLTAITSTKSNISNENILIEFRDLTVNNHQPEYAPSVMIPDCGIPETPVDGATNVPVFGPINSVSLSWDLDNNGIAEMDGVKIYLGTDPTNLIENSVFSPGVVAAQVIFIDAFTTYYWSIVPFNEFGEAEGCQIFSFTSGDAFDCVFVGANIGDPCDDGDSLTTNDVFLADCTCEGTLNSSCSVDDKNALEAIYASFDSPTLSGWDFSPASILDDSWEGITMTADGCNIEILSLDNYIGGTLAPEIGDLSQLVFLELLDTDIGGEIPSSIGNISTLLQFQAFGNAFTGAIPESMWSLPELEFLDLANSNLSGLLPPNAANTPALIEFVISGNNFSGCIPDSYQFFCDEYCEIYDNDLLNNDFDDYCATGIGGCGDFDGDGVLNDSDNCELISNPGQSDLDGDNEGDVCDLDLDGDGISNEIDCNPIDGNIYQGAPCDDLNSSTDNDTIQEDCSCLGTISDADGDGIPDASDNCPNNPNTDQSDIDFDEIGDECDGDIDGDGVLNANDCEPLNENIFEGATCDDFDANTTDDIIQVDCSCAGILIDTDNDGVTDALDNCPSSSNADQSDLDLDNLGDACDDDIDGDGVLNANDCDPLNSSLFEGALCDDGDSNTENDEVQSDCSCSGTVIFSCPDISANIGDPCDDGLYNTENDLIQPDCSCAGTLIVNENCANAISIVDGIYTDVQISAGSGAVNNCFVTGGTDALWYSYTANKTGQATVSSAIDLDEPDTRLSIYSGECASLTCEASNDDINSLIYTSSVTFAITEGTTYYIEWDDRWEQGLFDFEVSSELVYDCQALEVNFGDSCDDGDSNTIDDIITNACVCEGFRVNSVCDGAIEISTGTYVNPEINGGSGASNLCETGGINAIWYSYMAAESGQVTVSSENNTSNQDSRVSIYTGDCNTLDCLTSNDDIDVDAGIYTSSVSFGVTAGTSYLIEWDDRWSGDSFEFDLSFDEWECPALSANFGDSCDDGDPTTIDDEVLLDCTCSGVYSCNVADKITLEQIYNSWDGPNANLNWDFGPTSTLTSEWTGITVNNQGCVTKLILKQKGLDGIIDPAIGELQSLISIKLTRNSELSGSIPGTIGDLENLSILILSRNALEGNLPSNLSNLSNTLGIFNVRRNNIIGCIPASYQDFCGVLDVGLGNNPNWNNSSFQNFCNSGSGSCIDEIVENDESDTETATNKIALGSEAAFLATIYPNPNDGDRVFVKFSQKKLIQEEINLKIYSSYGQLVLAERFFLDQEESTMEIEFPEQISSGVYFIEFSTTKNRVVEKIIIE